MSQCISLMLDVPDVNATLDWYVPLGFTVNDTYEKDGCSLSWASRLSQSIGSKIALFVGLIFVVLAPMQTGDAAHISKDKTPQPIAPVVSAGTGLLLEPALTLPEFTPLEFEGVPIVADLPQLESRRLCRFHAQSEALDKVGFPVALR